MRAISLSVLALTFAVACGGAPEGKPFRAVGPEPSTFLVTPANPIEFPPTNALPQPTPGGANRAEQ